MMSLPQLLPLPEAARKLGVSVSELRERVEAGTIAAGVLPDGEIVVSKENLETNGATDINARLRAIKREEFEHLRRQELTISAAAKKYSVPGTTIRNWVNAKYIAVVNPGKYPAQLDEADLAYCASIHAIRKRHKSRAPLLDKKGNPYLLKHPELARARRIVREAR